MKKDIAIACLYTLVILSGFIVPFISIKLIDMVIRALHLA